MKKSFKAFLCLMLVAGMMAICGITSSCASQEQGTMYRSNQNNSKVINSNYKVTGNNRSNSATYRSY